MHIKEQSFHGVDIHGEYDPWDGNQYYMVAYVNGTCYVTKSSRRHRARKLLVKRLVRLLNLGLS